MKTSSLWRSPPLEVCHLPSPAISFLLSNPLILERRLPSPPPSAPFSRAPSDVFEQAFSDPIPLFEIIDRSPPFTFVLPKTFNFHPIFDRHPDSLQIVESLNAFEYPLHLILSSVALNLPFDPIEPLLVNIFAWDSIEKRRLSETWSFFAPSTLPALDDPLTRALVDPRFLDSPSAISLPLCPKHLSPMLVIFLDRLLMSDLGQSCNRYYQTGDATDLDRALAGCRQARSMMTFACGSVAFSELLSKSGRTCVRNFRRATSVSDAALAGLLGQSPPSPLPFELQMTVQCQTLELPIARSPRHYCAAGPLLCYAHELVLRPLTLSLARLRRSGKGALLLEFQLRRGGAALPIFAGEHAVLTRCLCHAGQLLFGEEIRVQLPPQVALDWVVNVRVIKGAYLSARGVQAGGTQVASGALPLFEDGNFITNGNHFVRLAVAKQKPSPEDSLVVETYLRSSLCSCDVNVSAILRGEVVTVPQIHFPFFLPHLFLILDAIIDRFPDIAASNQRNSMVADTKGFCMLVDIIKQFPEDPLVSDDARKLLAYVKFCAMRKPLQHPLHSTLLILWINYLGGSPIDSSHTEFGRIWFFLELVIKSGTIHKFSDWNMLVMITSTLVKGLGAFRSRAQKLGFVASRSLASFYKDCFEFGSPGEVFRLVTEHISFFDFSFRFDRDSFTEFIYAFFSPKTFIWTILPPGNGQSVFNSVFLPRFGAALRIGGYPTPLFRALLDVVLQFTPVEHRLIAPHLLGIVPLLDNFLDDGQVQRHEIRFFLVLTHFVLYYTPLQSLEPSLARTLGRIVAISRPAPIPKPVSLVATQYQVAPETTRRPSIGARAAPTADKRRVFGSFRTPAAKRPFVETAIPTAVVPPHLSTRAAIQPVIEEEDRGEQLYHSLLAILCRVVNDVHTPATMNLIVVKLCNAQLPRVLEPYLSTAVLAHVEGYARVLLDSHDSKIASVFVWATSNPDANRIRIINRIFELENELFRTTNRSTALFCRALFKHPPQEHTVEILAQTPLRDVVTSLYPITVKLTAPELRDNADAYSNLLLRKADLLSRSPDARIALLLELSNYHRTQKYNTEAVVTMLTAASLIAEYLDRLGRIPDIFKCTGRVIDFFAAACPSVVSERIPPSVLSDLPHVRGYATSPYFNEYGILWFLRSTAQALKLAELYELNVKIMQLFTVIAEHRLLWRSISDLYQTNCMLWQVIQEASRRNNRNLGSFWYIQFPDRSSFIYRFVGLVELNALSGRLAKEFEYHSDGLPVVVTNKGTELPDELPGDKYLVLLRAVQPYFSSEETLRRATAFLKAFGVGEFFFEIPEIVDGINATRRTIITLDVPMPFMVSRVEFSRENVRSEIVMPIRKACEDLEGKTNEIRVFMRCDDYGNIQRLVHGVLCAGCNGGPGQYVNEFLGPSAQENEWQPALRRALRDLLAVVQAGITVLKNPQSNLPPSSVDTYEELQNVLASEWQVSLG